ncbi:unnamed protein product [Chrysoparadoxa australica]
MVEGDVLDRLNKLIPMDISNKGAHYAAVIGEVADAVLKFLSERMPIVEQWAIEGLDTIFAPRLVLRHLVAALVLQCGLMTWNTLVSLGGKMLSRLNNKYREKKECMQQMKTAESYADWRAWAERLDELEGHDLWRKRPESLLYDHKVLQGQIEELSTLMRTNDVFGLMFRLRGSLRRSAHGMLHEGLFSRAHAGTKLQVERYHEAVCDALEGICSINAIAQDIPTDAKLAFFNETRHAYGRTALMLSGGASMGFYHCGVIKALMDQELMPRVISGASAGSIVAAMVGTRTDHELRPMFEGNDIFVEFFRPMRSKRRAARVEADAATATKIGNKAVRSGAFWSLLTPPALRWLGDEFWSLATHHDSLLKMDTDFFRAVLRHNIGSFTFQEAFDRTGRIVNIIVAPRNRTDPPRLLNYLTAPHVLVWSAAVCSSSVPGVFEPSTLLVKEADGSVRPEYGGRATEKFVDGSMEADLPMQQISELFNINHFLVSQVNPHATLLTTMSLPKSIWRHPLYSFIVGLVGFLRAQVRNWIKNALEFVSLRRMAPIWATNRGGIQLLTQEYEGRHMDVTITPWQGQETILSSFFKMLTNPSKEEFVQMCRISERNTFPKLDAIRSHCAVEMKLEQCVQRMRKQVLMENEAAARMSQTNNLHRSGRVPSFYTSRSIVNLSGLNVTDPANVMMASSSSNSLAMPKASSRLSMAGSEGAPGDVGLSMEVPVPYHIPLVDNTSIGVISEDDGHDGPSILPIPIVQNPNSAAMPMPLPMDTSEGSIYQPTEGEGDELVSGVVKSTSMAKFYYRRSMSWDAIHKSSAHGSNGAISSMSDDPKSLMERELEKELEEELEGPEGGPSRDTIRDDLRRKSRSASVSAC